MELVNVAGSNALFKSGSVVFEQGDQADSMYVIRKGELQVYLIKDGNEVKLASVGPGGMIGEMAFFDQQPRSASVKATADSEVTVITNDDFQKLMKQIPKWFVSIMTALSTRLRDTNSRLQKMENQASGAKKPYEDTLKILYVMDLLWHTDGSKENKYWALNRKTCEARIQEIFAIEAIYIKDLIEALVKNRVIGQAEDNYKNMVLTVPNRGVLVKLTKFIETFLVNFPEYKSVPESCLPLLDITYNLAKDSAYDMANIPFEDVLNEAEKESIDTSGWQESLSYFKPKNEAFQLVKVSSGIGFKVIKKELVSFISHHKAMVALTKAGLS